MNWATWSTSSRCCAPVRITVNSSPPKRATVSSSGTGASRYSNLPPPGLRHKCERTDPDNRWVGFRPVRHHACAQGTKFGNSFHHTETVGLAFATANLGPGLTHADWPEIFRFGSRLDFMLLRFKIVGNHQQHVPNTNIPGAQIPGNNVGRACRIYCYAISTTGQVVNILLKHIARKYPTITTPVGLSNKN